MDEKEYSFLGDLFDKAKELFVSKPNADQSYSKVKFPGEWKDFKDNSKDCSECFVNASKSLNVPDEVKSLLDKFLQDDKPSKNKNKRKKNTKWGGVLACLLLMIGLLAGALAPLFYNGIFKKDLKQVTVVSYSSYNINCCDSCRCCDTCTCRDTCHRRVRCDSVSFSLDTCKWDIKDTNCRERCDNKEVTIGPKGAVSYSYRKFDKLIIVLAMLLTIGVCTVLVFFIISMRKTIASDQEYEKSELDYRNRLIDKCMDALLDEHRLNVQHNENILEISRQKQLFQMDVYQKEQDSWWKFVTRDIESRKDFVTSFLSTVKTKSETVRDDKNKGGDDKADKTNKTKNQDDTNSAVKDAKSNDSTNTAKKKGSKATNSNADAGKQNQGDNTGSN